jgi:uncharacterized membrane protein
MREGMRESVPSALSGMTAARLRAAFVAASATWTFALVLAPLLATRAHASAFGTAVVVAAYAVGSLVCHQLPARSFHLWGAQMPVCARCTGIYVGAAMVAVVEAARAFRPGDRRVGVRLALRPAAMLAVAAVPTLLTLVYEWTTGVTPANWIRFAAGVPIGVLVAWLVVAASRNQVN